MNDVGTQVIAITGGSSGIGRATALEAARRGAKVAIAARGEDALAAARDEIVHAGGEAMATALDVADHEAVDAFANEVVARWGRIDTWVNAAAVSVYGEFADIPPAEFQRVILVDVIGTANGCRAAVAQMRGQEGGGTIVNVSSGLGDRAVPLQSAYCTAKYAVNGLSAALRMELEHAGLPIRLTVVKPASIDTPFFGHARSHMGAEPAPFPPVYDPSLAARAILYAAENPVRDLPVGGASAVLGILEGIAPRMLDHQLRVVGYPLQKGDTIDGKARPDNLWAASPGPGSVRGGHHGRRFSLYTALRINPAARRAVIAAVALAGFAAARRSTGG